ncbi:MAG TPA: hypothetical protein VJI70_00700 [Candidatus Paceibacterota bacterium]
MKSISFHIVAWVSICVAALVGQGFWYATIARKSATVADLQSQIDTKAETASRIASARTALVEIADDESVVQGYFVPETGVVSFIDDLEARARGQKAGIKVLSVSIGDAKRKATLVFSLTITGTFDAVMRTIGVIEYAPYGLSISKLSVGKDEKSIWHANLELLVGSILASPTTKTTS